MTHRDVELLAIGAGPSNLALAVALEELGPPDLAENSIIVERNRSIEWQSGLLLPWAKSQVSFLKDLATLRDPCSRFSFLNYLHAVGRLDQFVNMGSFTPYRLEISGYLAWVAASLTKVRVELGRACTRVEPRRDADGRLIGWLTRLADGDTISSRYLVIGVGRDPYVPPAFAGLSSDRVVHSTRYRHRVAKLPAELPHRVAVIGGAQSAAEMFRALQEDLPNSDVTWVMRSIGLRADEGTKFVNELYYPSYVDRFYDTPPEGREQILREMHRTNYTGTAPWLLDALYSDRYLDRLTGRNRGRIVPLTEVRSAREADGEVVLDLTDLRTGARSQLHQDLVLLGTGFRPQMPSLVRDLAASLRLDRIEVSRRYRLILDEPTTAACYLQGINEATHGISDSLLSVLAHRSADIVGDVLAGRAVHPRSDVLGIARGREAA
jgi:L-ornithine N5-monooxygenase